jgi:ppGpp synthetase/RelA/SpoT-type nucleotidyltranferase
MSDLTNSRVNRAGQRIRRIARGQVTDSEGLAAAIDTLVGFRALHAIPLQTATRGLRSAVTSERLPVQVSQRLKRVPTIIDKLLREPTLPLSRMQDIGGCRAILPTIPDIRAVQERLARPSRVRELVAVSDYIEDPRDSGYRGVHLIMLYRGRIVEIQLRTPAMHEWAATVERLTDRYGEDYKGAWHPVVGPFLAVVSEAMSIEESGGSVRASLVTEVDRQRIMMARYLQGRH